LLKFKPLEIMIGGRSKVSDTVEQHVEVRAEGAKWPRMLQLLGLWCDKGSILIFVDTQQRCDSSSRGSCARDTTPSLSTAVRTRRIETRQYVISKVVCGR